MRAGLRNPVRVAVAVAAAAAGAGGSTAKRAASAPASGPPPGNTAAAGSGAGATVTPSTLRLEYVTCEVEEKLGQLVRCPPSRGGLCLCGGWGVILARCL